MIVLSGASASGKTEVAKLLSVKYGIKKAITTTTRDQRIREVEGIDYFFVSKEKFLEMIKEGKFVEYTFFNGNYYGSTKDQIDENKCVVIDPEGLKAYSSLKGIYPIVTFFLEADEQTRINRMIFRGDDFDKVKSRIQHDKVAFAKDNIVEVDFRIDSGCSQSIENVADHIYNLYISKLK